MFKKDDYIVTLKVDPRINTDCAKDNYIFRQEKDADSLQLTKDLKGVRNGNDTLRADKTNYLKDWRYATAQEIAEYDRLGKPYDVTTLIGRDVIVSDYEIW